MIKARIAGTIRLLAALAAAAGCDARPSVTPGEECELNTQCDAPLVCRLGRCRVECRAQRDCGAGLECVRDEEGLGACQIPEETECTLSSDCPEILVCHFGACTNECETNRDCPPGAVCVEESEGSGFGCRDEAMMECTLHSDCPVNFICGRDYRCREQCRTDWDCSDGRVCHLELSPPRCEFGERPVDAGSMDGGVDASMPDSGIDGGMTTLVPPPPLMAAALEHTCATRSTSELYCWGENANGEVGNGSTSPALAPSPLTALEVVHVVEVGQTHSCAIAEMVIGTRQLFCWGSNANGRLGIAPAGGTRTSPVAVAGFPSAPTQLAVGNAHSCAIADGALYCWGANESGQLGVGDTSERTSPTLVALGGEPESVAAFSNHTCAILRGGSVECFGRNFRGQLGSGDTSGADSPDPMRVMDLDDAVQIAAGSEHTCALRASGDVVCWGANNFGQMGDGTIRTPPHYTPTPITDPGRVLSLAAGSAHTCARTESGVYCWGDNSVGQAGQDNALLPNLEIEAPAMVPGFGAVEEVGTGSNHTCVRVSGESIRCFGENNNGELGSGSTTPLSTWTPVDVAWP